MSSLFEPSYIDSHRKKPSQQGIRTEPSLFVEHSRLSRAGLARDGVTVTQRDTDTVCRYFPDPPESLIECVANPLSETLERKPSRECSPAAPRLGEHCPPHQNPQIPE